MISLIGEFFIVHIVDSAKRLVKYSWLLQVLVERDLKIRLSAQLLRIFMECFKSASDDDYFNDRFFQYVSLRYTPVPCISVGRTAYFRLLFRKLPAWRWVLF